MTKSRHTPTPTTTTRFFRKKTSRCQWQQCATPIGNIFKTLMDYDADMKLNPYTVWFASTILVYLFVEDPENKEIARGVKTGDEEAGEEVMHSIQAISGLLVTTLENTDQRIAMGYLMLLTIWLSTVAYITQDDTGLPNVYFTSNYVDLIKGNFLRIKRALAHDPLGEPRGKSESDEVATKARKEFEEVKTKIDELQKSLEALQAEKGHWKKLASLETTTSGKIEALENELESLKSSSDAISTEKPNSTKSWKN
ncbi:hypothetical protein Cantr_05877 [Candida viswanathii]|uniref:Vesicle tethering protein Uso1/P115-like head domain-containing protein n=1 Tax=Candida viswanathii TaxID=5486 RepID=A0A367XSU0_9ASCO|nr:hypothetical protein Cantr_05877 [Candida viswanathii]